MSPSHSTNPSVRPSIPAMAGSGGVKCCRSLKPEMAIVWRWRPLCTFLENKIIYMRGRIAAEERELRGMGQEISGEEGRSCVT